MRNQRSNSRSGSPAGGPPPKRGPGGEMLHRHPGPGGHCRLPEGPGDATGAPPPPPQLQAQAQVQAQAPSSCAIQLCPIQFVLGLIGHKWSIPILRQLCLGTRRTGELMDALPGISSKTLTQRLRQLEHHGLVRRQVYPEVPPHVEYSLTEKGLQVRPVLRSLADLGQHWLEQGACDCSSPTAEISMAAATAALGRSASLHRPSTTQRETHQLRDIG